MDHMRRNTLRLDGLRYLVLDEGDEMLRMGFIDDVEWILEQTPPRPADSIVLGDHAAPRSAKLQNAISMPRPRSAFA